MHASAGMAWLTWTWVWKEQPVASLYNAGAPKLAGARQTNARLASMELFGRPTGNQPVAEEVRRNAPETRLRLTLEGVMVAERPENSGAIVTSGVTRLPIIGWATCCRVMPSLWRWNPRVY